MIFFHLRHFGEANAKAMDMTWYKRAVDQHAIEPDSFVFSVPFDSGYTSKTNATLVTAAHAIFIEHRGHNKAPAAVVGLQFQHDSLARHFINITSACTGTGHCRKTCASDELDCYLLDNNGFIILSESTEHTGKFFGHIDGTIMDSLVQDRIYRRVTLMNYQGMCSDRDNPYSAAGDITRPNIQVSWLFKYIASLAATWMSFLPTPVHSWPNYGETSDFDKDLGEEVDESIYADEYDDEAFETPENYETPTPHPNVSEFKPTAPAIEFHFNFDHLSRTDSNRKATIDSEASDCHRWQSENTYRSDINATMRYEDRFVCPATRTTQLKHAAEGKH